MKRLLLCVMLVGCDSRPRAANPPAVVAPVPPAPQGWVYTDDPDLMRNTVSHRACLRATTVLQFSAPYEGGSPSMLCFGLSPRAGFTAFVLIERGQFACGLRCSLAVKFDDDEVMPFTAGTPSGIGSDGIQIVEAQGFLRRARTARRIIVEAEFHREGSQQIVFDHADGLVWPEPGQQPVPAR